MGPLGGLRYCLASASCFRHFLCGLCRSLVPVLFLPRFWFLLQLWALCPSPLSFPKATPLHATSSRAASSKLTDTTALNRIPSSDPDSCLSSVRHGQALPGRALLPCPRNLVVFDMFNSRPLSTNFSLILHSDPQPTFPAGFPSESPVHPSARVPVPPLGSQNLLEYNMYRAAV